MVNARRFDVFLVSLDPTIGTEIKKTRPCVIVSPDELNRQIQTVIIAPMTTRGRAYPFRVPVVFASKNGQVVLDQIRTIDKALLVKKLGTLPESTARTLSRRLLEMFGW